jgi:hypothetical protein
MQPPQSLLTSPKGVALGLPHDAGISIDSFKSAPSIHTQDRNPSWDILVRCAGRHHNRIAAGRSKGAVASRLSARVLPCLNGVCAQGLPRGPSHSFALRAPETELSRRHALRCRCSSTTLRAIPLRYSSGPVCHDHGAEQRNLLLPQRRHCRRRTCHVRSECDRWDVMLLQGLGVSEQWAVQRLPVSELYKSNAGRVYRREVWRLLQSSLH